MGYFLTTDTELDIVVEKREGKINISYKEIREKIKL